MSRKLSALDEALLTRNLERAAKLLLAQLRHVATTLQTIRSAELEARHRQLLDLIGITDLSDTIRSRTEILASLTEGRAA